MFTTGLSIVCWLHLCYVSSHIARAQPTKISNNAILLFVSLSLSCGTRYQQHFTCSLTCLLYSIYSNLELYYISGMMCECGPFLLELELRCRFRFPLFGASFGMKLTVAGPMVHSFAFCANLNINNLKLKKKSNGNLF